MEWIDVFTDSSILYWFAMVVVLHLEILIFLTFWSLNLLAFGAGLLYEMEWLILALYFVIEVFPVFKQLVEIVDKACWLRIACFSNEPLRCILISLSQNSSLNLLIWVRCVAFLFMFCLIKILLKLYLIIKGGISGLLSIRWLLQLVTWHTVSSLELTVSFIYIVHVRALLHTNGQWLFLV